MTEIKKALRHYGLTKAESNKPNWFEITNRLRLSISPRYRGLNAKSNKQSLLYRDFASSIKNQAIRKYAWDTTKVRVQYKIPYIATYKDKSTRQKVYTGSIPLVSRENIQKLIDEEMNEVIEYYNESGIIVTLGGNEPQIIDEEEVPEELGGNGLRKVKGVKYAKMRFSRALKLDNDYTENINFDRKVGTCCYDLLYYLYSPFMKRKMPDRETAYQGMSDFFGQETLETGLTILDLEKFCKANDVTIVALDKEEKLITYNKGKDRNKPALIFMISNSHIYPIFQKKKRDSIIQKHKEGEKFVTNLIEKTVYWDKIHTIIPSVGEETVEEKTLRVIKEKDIMPHSVGFDRNNNISRLDYKDEIIYIQEPEPEVLEITKEWKGENPVSIASQNWNEYSNEDIKSNFSPQAQEVFGLLNIKNRAHYGTTLGDEDIEYYLTKNQDGKTLLERKQETGEIFCIDINKSYPHALSNPIGDFLNYTEEDSWENYDGELKNGLYAVETRDLTLLRLSNVYTADILKIASENGIKYKILKQLIPKNPKKISKDYFKNFFQLMNEKYEGKAIVKLINNTITGILGKTSTKSSHTWCDQDPDEAWRYLASTSEKHKNTNLIFTKIGSGEDTINIFGYKLRRILNENTLPIYLQILDWQNIQLFNLSKLVGGKLLFRHTDCLVVENGTIPHDRMTDKWGDFKLEDKIVKLKSKANTTNGVIFNFRDDDWITYNITDSSESKSIIDLATEKEGLCIEGRAGTGKSFVIKKELGIWEGFNLSKIRDDTITMSFTNKASNAVKGTTIHKGMQISKHNKVTHKSIEKFKYFKYIVIDEIGMIPSYLWKLLVLIKKKYPNKIFILLGDYRQLPPVNEESIDIFNHPIVKYLCNNNRIELTTPHRYDIPLWNFLEKGFENEDWGGLPMQKVSVEDIYNNKSICFTNKTRVKINSMCMDYFKDLTESHWMPAPLSDGELTYKYTQDTWLYAGLPIMSYTNNNKLQIVNSDEFIVLDYDFEKVYISSLLGETLEIEIDQFHKLFVVNYCSTTHKSQGATYNCKVLLWEWNNLKQDKRKCYTACSRATDLNNLIICTNKL